MQWLSFVDTNRINGVEITVLVLTCNASKQANYSVALFKKEHFVDFSTDWSQCKATEIDDIYTDGRQREHSGNIQEVIGQVDEVRLVIRVH